MSKVRKTDGKLAIIESGHDDFLPVLNVCTNTVLLNERKRRKKNKTEQQN